MTDEEIKNNAPDGANGYIEYEGNIAYFKITSRKKETWINGEWNDNVRFLRYIRYFFKWHVINLFNGELLKIKPLR